MLTEVSTLHTVSGVLRPMAPFNFECSLDFAESFTPAMGEQTVGGGEIAKAVMVRGRPLLFRVAGASTSAEPRLNYTLYAAEPIGAELEAAAADRIRFYLSLDDDLLPFYRLADAEPPFRRIVELLYGFHQVKFGTPFENACWAVLTQRLAIPVARTIKQRLIERYGGSVEMGGTTYWAFPEADQLAAATEAELAALTRNAQKATYLAAVAQAFSGVDEAWLRTGDYAEVDAWLRGIKGIGDWSAHFVLVRGLGRMDRVPTSQNELLEAAARVYGHPMSPAELAAHAEHYAQYQGYWALYLRTPATRRI